ncbi:MAG: nitroreductase family protein [Acetatifactor sp.]|nr:nitroreductase family protein [Acetatifactor sp.]
MTSFIEEVKTRRSVRTFDGRSLDENTIEKLKNIASDAENPYKIPVIFGFFSAAEHDLSSPVLTGEHNYVTAKVTVTKNCDVAYGYSFQKLLMAAHSMGLGTVWIGGTMPRAKFEKAADVQTGEIMPCVSPLGYTAKKMGMKESLMRKGVKADTRYSFDKLFFSGDLSQPLSEEDAKKLGLYDALLAVQLAPSAVNKQPWRIVLENGMAHFYEKKDMGYDNGTYDLQKVDVGIAMYNFEHELITEGKCPVFTVARPDIEIDKDMEYIASYKLS